jgi:hypothetical protein
VPKLPLKTKKQFDPGNYMHLIYYSSYVRNKGWRELGECPFILEEPFSNIVSMINHKIAVHAIKKYI